MKYFKFKAFFPILLIVISLILCFQNYNSGAYLSGWDTLHPEFDFGLYFKRIFFGVWQEHQGLGAVASQSHAGEIPRIIILYLSSLFLPDSFLRFGYFFLTWVAGILGVYFFLKEIVLKNLSDLKREAISFSASLVYLLNLGTLQHYYVPLEMFATHFATLPWLFLFVTKYLQNGNKKYLLLFSLVTLFATSISHTSTLFYAYFLSLLLYVGALTIFNLKEEIKRALAVILVTLLLNSFWLLPNIYFILNHGPDIPRSKIHAQFSEKAFLTGEKFANFKDTAVLKNFLFDWGEYDYKKGQFVDLFDEWKPHLNNPLTISIGYAVFVLALSGGVLSVHGRNKYGISLLPVALTSFFFIANDMVLIRDVFGLLQNRVPLFAEALRFPFTKFSILLMFAYAVYFAIALNYLIIAVIKLIKHEKLILFTLSGFILIVLSYYMLPAFSGNLISKSMKVNIPKEYFAAFSWFKNQKDKGRIANFPIHTFWGWLYYDWQYEGAGFLWFGLEQPLLDREFDRWNPANENYYWEISYALYSKNQQLFEKVLEKYQIRWLLVDKNVINPPSAKALYFEELELMLKNSKKISLAQQFEKIKVYKVNLEAPIKDFVFLAENLPTIGPIYKWNNYDQAYIDNGNYISLTYNLQPTTYNLYYPFRSLFTGKKQEDLEFSIEDRGGSFVLKKNVPDEFKNYSLQVPKVDTQELIWVDPNDLSKTKIALPEIFFDGKILEVKVPKVNGYFAGDINPGLISKDCKNITGGFLRLTLVDNSNCASFYLPNLSHNLSYLITAESENLSGLPILFWLENPNSRRADIETYLPKTSNLKPNTSYFIQPPMEKDGVGYTLHFDNISIGKERAVNTLGKITVNPLPYKFLTGLVFKKPSTSKPLPVKLTKLDISHPNPSLYVVNLQPTTYNLQPTLILSQSFDAGWKTYGVATSNWPLATSIKTFLPFIFGKEIKEHVLVNNWANGWTLNNYQLSTINYQLVIVYLPQYLEYLGFGLLVSAIVLPYLSTFLRRDIKRLK